MTKQEAMNLSQYYIGRAAETSGAACVLVVQNGDDWRVVDLADYNPQLLMAIKKEWAI